MNQILSTKKKEKKKSNKILFKFQFVISIMIIAILLIFIFYYFLSLQKKEKLSKKIIGNYNIYKLYHNYSQEDMKNSENKPENELFGVLEIPKINIYYPIFSHLNEELLKTSPCKFFGKSPDVNGNICIAGHNYNNSMFFSNLSLLKREDKIYIYDNLENKYIYSVFNCYEVNESDLSPIFNYNPSSKELTLVTCNNTNQNRIIIKARQ